MVINIPDAIHSAKNKKGYITVEACISLPVFLCFFLALAFFIRIAVINITLNHAVNESVKQLAASAYPLKFLNELEDEVAAEDVSFDLPAFEEELNRVRDSVLGSKNGSNSVSPQDLISGILAGNIDAEGIEEVLNDAAGGMTTGDIGSGIGKFLAQQYSQQYFEAKARAKYAAAGYLIQKFLQTSRIDISRLEYLMVMLPQSDAEMEIRNADPSYLDAINKVGIIPDKNDVVIAIQYR
ncbi:MAG: hypothetical protein K0R31_259, partial [Clostridiales bacterium]|nr:hypothetical protein [Clostridiales bacterium]